MRYAGDKLGADLGYADVTVHIAEEQISSKDGHSQHKCQSCDPNTGR